jgi:hypothetical protein
MQIIQRERERELKWNRENKESKRGKVEKGKRKAESRKRKPSECVGKSELKPKT